MIILEMIVYVTVGSFVVRIVGELLSGLLDMSSNTLASLDDVTYPD